MTQLTWQGAVEWDNAQLEQNVRHETADGQSWAGPDTLELGYPSTIADTISSMSGTLLAYYPLGETSGTIAYDVSGLTDGEYRGPTLGALTGPFGDPIPDFDGVDDFMDTNITFASAGTSSVSDHALACGAWIRKTAWATSYENVFSNWDGSNGGIRLQRDGSNNYFRISMASRTVTGVTNVADGNWHFVFGQMDSGNLGELYVDGAVDGSALIGNADSSKTTQHHYLAAQPNATTADPPGANFWDGEIAHFMAFDCFDNNTASLFTQAEVQRLANVTANAQFVSAKKVS